MPEEITISITATVNLTPAELIGSLTAEQQRCLIHEICATSAVSIAEIRSIVNSPGYDD